MFKNSFVKKFKQALSGFIATAMTLTIFASIPVVAQTGITTFNYSDFTVEYNIMNEWTGFQNIQITVTNTGDEPIYNWALKYNAGGEVTGIYNGVVVDNNGTNYVIKNAGYNYEIMPNASVNFGYTLAGDNLELPKNFENFSKRVDITEGFDVQLIVTNEWDEGFNGDIILSNTSSTPLEAWMLSFDTNFEIADLWGGALVENSASSYKVSSLQMSNPIQPGASVSVGVTAVREVGVLPSLSNVVLSVVQIGEAGNNNGDDDDDDDEITITATAEYDSETGLVTVKWESTVKTGSFEILVLEDGEDFTVLATVSNVFSYSFAPAENFERLVILVRQTVGERIAVSDFCFVFNIGEEIDWSDITDTDGDGLTDLVEIYITKTDPNNPDTDGDMIPDGYELFWLGTDPAKADTDGNGVSDGDEDFDNDGLTNYQEYINETNPHVADTDEDGLSDGDEVNVHNTNPNNKDTDGDGVSDYDELILGLDPNNPRTFGYPDSEYTVQQTISADSDSLSEINSIAGNPFDVSLEIKAAGVVANNIEAFESVYSYAMSNDAIIGVAPQFVYNEGLKVDEVVVSFNLDNSVVNNTHGGYAGTSPEFEGIKRLNVFRYFEDLNMLLPVETFHDVANNRVYAEFDDLGTYCLMDMEIWLASLGIEPEENYQPISPAMSPIMPMQTTTALMGSNFVEEGDNLDVIITPYISGLTANNVNLHKAELKKTADEIFRKAAAKKANARIYFVLWTGNVVLNPNDPDKNYVSNYSEAEIVIDQLTGIDTRTMMPDMIPLQRVITGITQNILNKSPYDGGLRADSKKYLFITDHLCNPDPGNTGTVFITGNVVYRAINQYRELFNMDTFFIMNMNSGSKPDYVRLTSTALNENGHLDINNLNYGNCFEMSIKAAHYAVDEQGNQILDEYGEPIVVPARLAFSEFVIDVIFDTFVDDGAIRIMLPTGLKPLPDDFGKININSDQDYDDDGFLDVDEINFELEDKNGNKLIKVYSNGYAELPTYVDCIEALDNKFVKHGLTRFYNRIDGGELLYINFLKAFNILPVHSDPTLGDSDGDGLDDELELAIGTNPFSSDSDGDGLSDGLEFEIGFDPLDTNPDGDWYSDKREYENGTCPFTYDFASGEWAAYFVEGLIIGDFSPNNNTPVLLGTIIRGIIPILGVGADVTDTLANLTQGQLIGAGFSAIGVIPLAGDAAKAAGDLGKYVFKNAGDAPKIVGAVVDVSKEFPDVVKHLPVGVTDHIVDSLHGSRRISVSKYDELRYVFEAGGKNLDEMFSAGKKSADELIDSKNFDRFTGKVTNLFSDSKGYSNALADFESMPLYSVSVKSNGTKVGYLPDGRVVNVREISSQGFPTLEILDPVAKTSHKIRY
ncbi:MAG: cellulose binding domain-containing protein [Oscillospiraceae bacterium]|nr:cellulose binding domain-containing protein [Oscillospiraceae bacterium]